MDTCDLINRAADHIERYPDLYDFDQGHIASPKHSQCMLARIGQMAGIRQGLGCGPVAAEIFGLDPRAFYDKIHVLAGGQLGFDGHIPHRDIVADPARVTGPMRRLAENYRGIPVCVRAIFMEPPKSLFEKVKEIVW